MIQQVGLFPHKTVLENTATVPHLLGWKRGKARERAAELLDLVGLDPSVYGDRYRNSFPAASANASEWPAHWPPIRPFS